MRRKHPIILMSLALVMGLGKTQIAQASAVAAPPFAVAAPLALTAQPPTPQPTETGRYTVEMPVVPDTVSRTTTVQGGTLNWTVASARQGDGLFAVAYTDLPLTLLEQGQEEVIQSLQSRPFWDDFDWQAIANRGQPISLHGLPGMEFLHFAAGRYTVVRFYLANRRLYGVMATASELSTVQQFVDSFRIDPLWRPFVSEAGRFRVDVTMAPVVTPQGLDYQGTRLNWQQFTFYNLMAPGDAYQIAYADLPPHTLSSNPDDLLANIANQLLTAREATAIADSGKVITLQGYPGREYMTTTEAGRSYVLRLYQVDDRLYGVLVGSRSLNHLHQFLSSFQIQ